MTIKYINHKEIWESLLNTWPEANFLQSWNWGQFHQSLGKKVYYLAVMQDAQRLACALVILEKAKRGNYLTIAGGPLANWQINNIENIIVFLLTELKKIALAEQAVFLRIRLQEIATPHLKSLIQKIGFKLAPMHLSADLTIQLDLTRTETEILQAMRKNTRYEIKKADKLNIKTVFSKNSAEIKDFYHHQLALAQKQKFIPFSYQFLQNQFDAFVKDDQVLLIHSFLNQTLLASAFIIFYRNEAVYHYGISTLENQKLPGSYVCQWAAIKEAKKRGLKFYNFWGVAPKDQPNHRFAGVGIFKRGFGGQEIEYLPAYDFPFSWQYNLIKIFELLRKKVRSL